MPIKTTAASAAAALTMAMSSSAGAALTFDTDSGWAFGLTGYVPVFAIASQTDSKDSVDADGTVTRGADDNFAISTGFNPVTLQFNIQAPTTANGIDVSGHFQVNNHIGGGGTDELNGGFDNPASDGNGIESRVAKLMVSGSFGTFDIGKGFGIFGTPAIGDEGSAMGVGDFGGIAGGSATGGRIGTGYFYANFNPRVIYIAPDLNGLQFKVGIFNPTVPTGGDYNAGTPRVEAGLTYSTDMFAVWTSGGYQNVEAVGGELEDYTQSGVDAGGSFSIGGFDIRGNYSITTNTGGAVWGIAPEVDADGEAADDEYHQWYVEPTYTLGSATFGVSYGEGELDVSDATTRELTMGFVHYDVTEQFTLIGELQHSNVDGDDTSDANYDAFIVGSQFTF